MFVDYGFEEWREATAKRRTADGTPAIRFTITCEECGRRQVLARSLEPLEVCHVICHDCELPLRVAWAPG
jgi:hypothetical protein